MHRMTSSLLYTLLLIHNLIDVVQSEVRKSTCWSTENQYILLDTSTNTSTRNWTLSESDLVGKCRLSFVENITNKTCVLATETSDQRPTTAQKYGWGFLSVFIISILSLTGFLAYPLMKKPYYKYINSFFVALAVGTLYADSAFELFPTIIEASVSAKYVQSDGLFQTPESQVHSPRVSILLWQMTTLVLTSYVFYVIELFIHLFMHWITAKRQAKSETYQSHTFSGDQTSIQELPETTGDIQSCASNTGPISAPIAPSVSLKSIGWVIIVGDGIHNIADGLAIGAAFAENAIFGLTTAIAIACHELPTELGEYMVLIESGFTFRRALLFNLLSAFTAIVGFFIGASIGENETARTWIFVVTAGTFGYIALVALWPTLMPERDQFDWIRFACVTAGYLLGVFIMFVLTFLEEEIFHRASV